MADAIINSGPREAGADPIQISGGDGATISNTEAKTAAEMQQLAGVIKYSVMIVSTLPIIVVYPFLQRFFVKGVMIGSIKG